jgi:GTP-binding protein
MKMNQNVVVSRLDGTLMPSRITKLYGFKTNQQVEIPDAGTGEVIAVAGIESIRVGETITEPTSPIPLPAIPVDPPTISINFLPNDSPFSGQEGDYVTSRHIKERLERELLSDVALQVEALPDSPGFKVSGRGELHLSILIEKMRREGYEFAVSQPKVIFRTENGKKMEPFEELTIDVDEEYMGAVIEALGIRKGTVIEMHQSHGRAHLKYKIPTRGLLGYQSQFMMDTRGMGVMNYVFAEYSAYAGEIRQRKNGVLISMENGETVAYALFSLQERGTLFLGAGERIYEGQLIGENAREDDMTVNPAKAKKLTNIRSAGADEAIVLTPPRKMTLEQCIAFINDDELVEVTPKSIRLRKIFLKETERKRSGRN